MGKELIVEYTRNLIIDSCVIIPNFQMLTNKEVHAFLVGYSGSKTNVVPAFCSKHGVPFDSETMGSKVIGDRMYRIYNKCKKLIKKRDDSFCSTAFEIRVLERSANPVSVEVVENRQLKRKVRLFCRLSHSSSGSFFFRFVVSFMIFAVVVEFLLVSLCVLVRMSMALFTFHTFKGK